MQSSNIEPPLVYCLHTHACLLAVLVCISPTHCPDHILQVGKMATKIKFAVTKTNGKGIICTVKFEGDEDENWYQIPVTMQSFDKHDMLKKNQIASAFIANLSENSRRELKVLISEELKAKYQDEAGNVRFLGNYLQIVRNVEEWLKPNDTPTEKRKTVAEKKLDDIDRCLNELRVANEMHKLKELERKFNISPFKGLQSAEIWMNNFEMECERFAVILQGEKVRALKRFLEGTPLKWYELKEATLAFDNWDIWKNSFLEAFGANGWTQVTWAFKFYKKGGSFTEYAIEKMRLLTQAVPTMSEKALIAAVVAGIPSRYQEKINKSEATTVDKFLAALGRMPKMQFKDPPNTSWKSNNEKNQNNPPWKQNRFNEKFRNNGDQSGFQKKQHDKQKTSWKPKAKNVEDGEVNLTARQYSEDEEEDRSDSELNKAEK